MRVISDIGADLERPDSHVPAAERAERYLQLGEEVLEHWTRSKDMEPTSKTKEGFRSARTATGKVQRVTPVSMPAVKRPASWPITTT